MANSTQNTVDFNEREDAQIISAFVNGMPVVDIAMVTGRTNQSIKRLLAEAGHLYLSWHKTTSEDEILRYLNSINITDVSQLKQIVNKVTYG